jgi:phosphatidylglycerophosphatase A
MSKIWATWFGIGYLRPGSGTWASALAVLMGYLLHATLGFPGFALVTLAVTLLGFWSIASALPQMANSDPSEFVIDEVAGQWIALLPASAGFWHAGLDPWSFPWPAWLGAFVLFRLFDIWKPGPIGWADRIESPAGVMLDDIFAGLIAAVFLIGAAGLYHGVLAQ